MHLNEFFYGSALRSLYVCRPVVNTDEIREWAKSQGFASTLPGHDMHITLAYSKQPVDWTNIGESLPEHRIDGGHRAVHRFDGGAVVLELQCPDLEQRWQYFRDIGADWKHASYRPHVTITYQLPEGLDVSKIEPFRGAIVLGPEQCKEVDSNWQKKLEEEAFESDQRLDEAERVTNLFGEEVTLYRNPTARQLIGFLNRTSQNEMRGIIQGDDIVWWDSYYSVHRHMRQILGVRMSPNLTLRGIMDGLDLKIDSYNREMLQNPALMRFAQQPQVKMWDDGGYLPASQVLAYMAGHHLTETRSKKN